MDRHRLLFISVRQDKCTKMGTEEVILGHECISIGHDPGFQAQLGKCTSLIEAKWCVGVNTDPYIVPHD